MRRRHPPLCSGRHPQHPHGLPHRRGGISPAAACAKPPACREHGVPVGGTCGGFLVQTQGNVLLATGAKELPAFAQLAPERLYPRVLPTLDGIAACEAAHIPHKNILALQGPFSYALNRALLEQFSIRFLVTKDGGAAGGFAEKAQAAADTGVQLIVIRRPAETGETADQILTRCREVLKG